MGVLLLVVRRNGILGYVVGTDGMRLTCVQRRSTNVSEKAKTGN